MIQICHIEGCSTPIWPGLLMCLAHCREAHHKLVEMARQCPDTETWMFLEEFEQQFEVYGGLYPHLIERRIEKISPVCRFARSDMTSCFRAAGECALTNSRVCVGCGCGEDELKSVGPMDRRAAAQGCGERFSGVG